jgi:endonuclease YncB( thermonuclease family)
VLTHWYYQKNISYNGRVQVLINLRIYISDFRDVFVEVENMDRGGNFIGRLTTADGQSAALMLVQAGLAKVHDSAYGTPNYKQLLEAEDKCRKERIGVWTNYEEPTAKDDDENEGENAPEGNLIEII